MTTRQVVLLGLFLLAAAGLHAVVGQLLPARQSSTPLASGILEQGSAPVEFAGKFAKGDPARVYDRFIVVEHGDEIAVIPSDKFTGVVLRKE